MSNNTESHGGGGSSWKTRNVIAGGAGALALANTVATHPGIVAKTAGTIMGVTSWTGEAVHNMVNATTSGLSLPLAGVAAPFATAGAAAYLTTKVMDKLGVDGKAARTLAQAGSAALGY